MEGHIFILVGIYSESDADLICMLPGNLGGVTQVQFSKDGVLLFAGARRVISFVAPTLYSCFLLPFFISCLSISQFTNLNILYVSSL